MNRFTSSLCRSATLIGYSLGLPLAVVGADDAPEARPNILFIFTDDQRWDDIGYRNPFVYTPNLDRLSHEGVRFNQATIVLPVCSPTRAAALTGRYGLANGVTTYHTPLNKGEVTFAWYLQDAGYLTAMIGKWHILPEEARYQDFRGYLTAPDRPSAPIFYEFDEVRDLGNTIDFWQPVVIKNGEEQRAPGASVDYVVDETIQIMKQAAQNAQPFGIYLSTLEPHGKLYAQGNAEAYAHPDTLRYYREHPLDTLPVPKNFHGTSLKRVLKDRIPLDREYVLLEHLDENTTLEVRPAYALRSREWKYIRTYEDGKDEPFTFEELYDLTADPYELNNLAGQPDQMDRMVLFREKINRKRGRMSE